jgi:hypothetical protein
MLTGFDGTAWVGDKSELFISAGDALGEVSELFLIAGSALEDGILTEVELEGIITQAKTIPEAVKTIIGFFGDDIVEPTPPVVP